MNDRMKNLDHPFTVPRVIAPTLRLVRDYWAGLKRGGNDIPFADDLRLTSLPDLAKKLLLADVFAMPQRFRLSAVGDDWLTDNHGNLLGKFLDEIGPGVSLLGFLQSQCAATVEGGRPTWYLHNMRGHAYERLLLPLWGDGRINMIFGAVERRR